MCIGEALFLCAVVGAVASWLEYDMRPVYAEFSAGADLSPAVVPRPDSCRVHFCSAVLLSTCESHSQLIPCI